VILSTASRNDGMASVSEKIYLSILDPVARMKVYGASRISLCQEAGGEPGRDYLLRQRSLDWGTVAAFRLGFVPFRVNHPFAGRIVIPIFNSHDELIALSVRPVFKIIVLRNQEICLANELRVEDNAYAFKSERGEEVRVEATDAAELRDPKPKYWNEIFPKGETLFGLNIAKYTIAKWGFAILVEGQMDVMALHSRGITNAVGIMGGAFTTFHAKLLSRWTRRLVVLMDGDQSGRRHADKAREIMAVYENNPADWTGSGTRRARGLFSPFSCLDVRLPEGSDPDSFARRYGGDGLVRLVTDASLQGKMRIPDKWALDRAS
jgi:hypothetical protein